MLPIALSKRQLVNNATALAAVLAIVALASGLARPQPQHNVRLYDAMFSQRDMFAISEVLSEEGLTYETTEEHTILVEPAHLWAARSAVAEAGLPRDTLIRVPKLFAGEVERTQGKTATEREMTRQQLLEGEITFCLRQVPGVRDAQVKLAKPKKVYFMPPDGPQTTARVLLDLEPGHLLSKRSLQGMHQLIVGSVPELLPENITIVDTSNRDLTSVIYPQRRL